MPGLPLSPKERQLRSRMGAHTSWANTSDPAARTAPARKAFLERFEHEVDRDGVLDPDERRRRADHALRAHMARLALRSSQARRKAS